MPHVWFLKRSQPSSVGMIKKSKPRWLIGPGGKRHRLNDGIGQADLSEIGAIEINTQAHMVANDSVTQDFTFDTATPAGHSKPWSVVCSPKQPAHLVALASALAINHFREGSGWRDPRRPFDESSQCLPGKGHEIAR
nr:MULTISPECIES: hypothetical protein [Comamonas]